MKNLYCILIATVFFSFQHKTTDISFFAQDSVSITATAYIKYDDHRPFIILFHQAGWSRGEYLEIAPKLNSIGYNCIAIDQRSGAEVNEIINQTNRNAKNMNKNTTYLDAYADMQAALNYVKNKFKPEKIIAWGSSYSAALSLKLAAVNSNDIHGVLAFSPGEYFQKFGKSETYIAKYAKNISCPVFITSARDEKDLWKNIYATIQSKDKYYFIPNSNGNHGSRSLWEKFDDSKEYWKAVNNFLKKYFPVKNN